MQSVRNSFVRRSVFSVLALTFALTLGSSYATSSTALAQQPAQEPAPGQSAQDPAPGQAQNQKQSTTFTGTISHSGGQYVLRDSSGTTYTLDDSERAKAFDGKAVKVTGQLDQEAKMIHVENIEPVAA